MTKEEILQNHKLMWMYLSDHPDKTKEDYLQSIGDEEDIPYDCYLCMYTNVQCSQCSVKWDIRDPITDIKYDSVCFSTNGLFTLYCNAFDNKDYREVSRLASLIAKLKEKE